MRGHFFTMYLYQYHGSVEPLMYHVLRMSVFIILAQTLKLAVSFSTEVRKCTNKSTWIRTFVDKLFLDFLCVAQ